MAKMRIYKFWNRSGTEKRRINEFKEGYVMSVQGDFKDEVIGVEYVSKKGKKITSSVKMLIGRKIRQSIIYRKKEISKKSVIRTKAKERYGS